MSDFSLPTKRELYAPIHDQRRKCAACGRWCGTKYRPGVEFSVPVYVEGYPPGQWGRVDPRNMVCMIHSLQVQQGGAGGE